MYHYEKHWAMPIRAPILFIVRRDQA